MSFLKKDTICAIATAAGTSAISIIRMSGDDSHKIATRCFTRKNNKLTISDIKSNRMYYVHSTHSLVLKYPPIDVHPN